LSLIAKIILMDVYHSPPAEHGLSAAGAEAGAGAGAGEDVPRL